MNLETSLLNFSSCVIIIPIMVAILILLFPNRTFVRTAFLLNNICLFLYSIFAYRNHNKPISYVFGDWEKNVGIEFKQSLFSIIMIALLYFLTSIFSLFGYGIIKKYLNNQIIAGRKNLPYALFLIVQAGYSGIILTNDLFNLYVFVEIASLATYPLLAIGSDKRSYIGAFDYLILGSVAASMILISIGLLLAKIGSLNIEDLKIAVSRDQISSIIVILFFVGVFIKLASFPFQFWKLRSYSFTSPVIVLFFISTSTLPFIMILYKFSFLYFVDPRFKIAMDTLGLASMIYGSIFAARENDYKSFVTYISIASTSYYLFLWPYNNQRSVELLIQFLIADSLVKLALMFLLVSLNREILGIRDLIGFGKKYQYHAWGVIFLLIFASGIPPTIVFFNKLAFCFEVIKKSPIILFGVLVSSVLSVYYSLRVVRQLMKTSDITCRFQINNSGFLSITFIVVILMMMLLYSNEFLFLSQRILDEGK